jgi:5-formyltetrahydrofolate cyclo-ligase
MRARLVGLRRAVPTAERMRAAQLVARNVDRFLHLKSHWRIAAYAAVRSELDAGPLLALAGRRGCSIYLPRINRRSASRAMRFVRLEGRLRRNRLGIDEPDSAQVLGARWLDVVFLPLVGFDRCGLRLGTGGGFYDRAFAFRHLRTAWHAPRLIGLAYSFQQVEYIAAAAHDVPLDAVVTEKGIIQCSTG